MKTEREAQALIEKLRNGKRELRAARRSMSLREKVREVVQLQRVTLSAIRRRREPEDWEYVWALREKH